MEDLRSDALLAKTTEVKGYKILPPCVLYARVGAGGMGAVYRGHHLNLDIDVAVKCLKPSLVADDPTFVDRFKREGRSAAKINHQNVIRVFDVAENLGLHYLIMEFVSGETARQRVERKGALQLGEALQIVYEASLGLGEAHRMGIIHRDVKPDNLLISSRGQVKVADLGLAKPAVSSGQSMLSMAGQVMGTPPYMPPEQWGEGTVTAASDVWAMGAVLYFLLTAQEAIAGDSLAAIMSKIVLHDFPDVRELRPDIPDSVMAVLQKATARAPGERYLDAYELADAIAALPEHRIALADTDAGTTELHTMLSPPPNARINEIKKELATRTPTMRENISGIEPEPQPVPDDDDDNGGGRFPWGIVLLLLVLGGGGAGYYFKDQLFGTEPAPAKKDLLQEAQLLRGNGEFCRALKKAREVFAANPELTDEAFATELRNSASAKLQGTLKLESPTGPVKQGEEVTFAGSFDDSAGASLMIGATVATVSDGKFEAQLMPPEDGKLKVTARITDEDIVDLDEWTVTFEEIQPPVTPPTAAFASILGTEPKLGTQDTTDQKNVVIVGKANDRDLELRWRGKVLDDVKWDNDGTFRARIDLLQEGRNTIELTIARPGAPSGAATTAQKRSIEIVRLTEPPSLDLISPISANASTEATEVALQVTTDEWTKSVTGTAGKQQFTFTKNGTDKNRITWRATSKLQLTDGKNTAEIVATNLTDKTKKQAITITCTAKPIEITDITLSVGIKDYDVSPDKTYFVNRQPEVAAKLNTRDATFFYNDTKGDLRFLAAVPKNKSKVYVMRAEKGLRKSKPFSFTIVYDADKPQVAAKRLAEVAPNSTVTLNGSWSDNFGIESIKVSAGQVATIETLTATSGSWSARVRVGATAKTFTLTATDKAGNVSTASTTVNIVKPKPTPKPIDQGTTKPVVINKPPQPKPPAIKLSTKINQALFEPLGKLNKKGFPRELRHRQTGIELVAINYVDTMAPSVYVGKRVVTEQQWSGNGGSEPQTSITHAAAYMKLQEPRFSGLSMVTKQQWTMVSNASTEGLIRGEKYEWLAVDQADSVTMRAAAGTKDIRMMKVTDSNSYIGFRVSFSPR